MNKSLLYFGFGLACTAAGFVCGVLYSKEKYKAIADEEISSVKAAFNDSRDVKEEPVVKAAKSLIEKAKKPEIIEYAEKIQKEQYTNYSASSEPKTDISKKMESAGISYVRMDEFDTIPGYETYSLVYYADGVLADDLDDIIDDVKATLGEGFAAHFGDEDVIFVQNDVRQCYYEVSRDNRTYMQVVGE